MYCVPVSNYLVYFSVFFKNLLNAAAVSAKLIDGVWCMEPMKIFSCLKVFGGESFSTASVSLIKGEMPSLFIVYPATQTYVCPIIWRDFYHLIFPESFVCFRKF